MLEEARKDAVAMLEAAGCTNINSNPVNLTVPGNRIHEMGSARMGNDPSDSVLNKWCQTHDVPNLFVTDGAFHDLRSLSKSINFIHGFHRKGLRSRGQTNARQSNLVVR